MLTYLTLPGPTLTADQIAKAATTALHDRLNGTDDRFDLEPAHAARLALLDLGISSCDARLEPADAFSIPSITVECGSRGSIVLVYNDTTDRYHPTYQVRVDMTWTATVPILVALIERGTTEGRRAAIDELLRMARVADSANGGDE